MNPYAKFCYVKIEDGAIYAYLPDGTRIPGQIDTTLSQTAEQGHVTNHNKTAELTVKLLVTLEEPNK